jgi:hypothetical protein
MKKFFALLLIGFLGIYLILQVPVLIAPRALADVATSTVQVSNVAPTVSNVVLNGGAAIGLTENTTTSVLCTGTITDNNGGSDITSATATVYRTSLGSSCTADDNNCYQNISCTLSAPDGNNRYATCTAAIWFHAEPTDTGSPWAADTWSCTIVAQDASNATGSADSAGVELNTLIALDFTPSIDYGSYPPGSGDASTTHVTTATTTGNAAIDVNLSGTNMTSGGNSISVSQEHYATSTVAYSSGIALTTTPTLLELTTGKPTAHPSNQAQNIYWGIQIPAGTPVGTYTGQVTATAVAD